MRNFSHWTSLSRILLSWL